MRRLHLFFMILICVVTVVYSVEAHDPMEIGLSNAWTSYDSWERILGAAVVKLVDLKSQMGDLKGSWDSVKKAQRDNAISMLTSIGGKSVLGFIDDCLSLGLILEEEASLRDALSDAINAVERQYNAALYAERARNFRYSLLLKKISDHNEDHGSRTHLNYKNPVKASYEIVRPRYSFYCEGGCPVSMNTPNEALNAHATKCVECKRSYYSCNESQKDFHKERPCTQYITVYGWFTNNKGKQVWETQYFTCMEKHRWCSPGLPTLHDFFKNKRGDFYSNGPLMFHQPQPPSSP